MPYLYACSALGEYWKIITIIGKGTKELGLVMHYDFQKRPSSHRGKLTVTGTIGGNYQYSGALFGALVHRVL